MKDDIIDEELSTCNSDSSSTERTLEKKISDAEAILERILGFNNNSESKTGITLTIVGVILTVIFALSGDDILNIFRTMFAAPDTTGIIFVILFFISLITAIYGIYRLVRVLVPVLDSDDCDTGDFETDSRIFFGNIYSNNKGYNDYRDKMLSYCSEEHLNDLWSQIYVNSRVCSKKFKNFNAGLKVTLPSLFILLAIIVIFRFLILG